MKNRVLTSIVLIVVLVILLVMMDSPLFILAISFLSIMAVFEMLFNTGYVKNKYLVAYSTFVAGIIPFIYKLRPSLKIVALLAFVYLAVLVLFMLKLHNELSFKQFAVSFFVTATVPQLFSIFVLFRDISTGHGLFYVILVLCGSWVSDTGAFFAGKLFGKHKLSPQISPNKTVEGFIGGIVLSTLSFLVAGFIYSFIFANVLNTQIEMNYILLLITGPIASVAGVCGDLFASVIKRQTGIKDYGDIMPGHGGIMDRFDSVLFVLPTLALLLVYLPPIVVKIH